MKGESRLKMLFLDDIRAPQEVGNYMNPVELRTLYRNSEIDIVRNYKQFCEYIQDIDLRNIDIISFDHDLADEHYSPEMYWGKESYDEHAKSFKEKTGYDCAKFLISYCAENGIGLPLILCHSMNPVGRENILNLFNGR